MGPSDSISRIEKLIPEQYQTANIVYQNYRQDSRWMANPRSSGMVLRQACCPEGQGWQGGFVQIFQTRKRNFKMHPNPGNLDRFPTGAKRWEAMADVFPKIAGMLCRCVSIFDDPRTVLAPPNGFQIVYFIRNSLKASWFKLQFESKIAHRKGENDVVKRRGSVSEAAQGWRCPIRRPWKALDF